MLAVQFGIRIAPHGGGALNYGLHLSASGVLTNMYRQDVFANNLANVGTVGFKRDLASISQRAPESIESGQSSKYHNALLDQLGGGVSAGPQKTDFSPGPIDQTNRALDAALTTKNTFFAVAFKEANGNESVRLTRDGRFFVNGDGFLSNINGERVLNEADQPIQVDPKVPITIDPTGRLIQGGESQGQIQVAQVADPSQLIKQGQNLFRFKGADPRIEGDRTGRIHPKALESSTVDPIKELLAMIEASGAVESNANMIKYHDLMMDNAVNRLGRVNG